LTAFKLVFIFITLFLRPIVVASKPQSWLISLVNLRLTR